YSLFLQKLNKMKQSNTVILIAILMILAAAISRVLIYPVSFSPLIAMSLFGGAVIQDKKLAFIIPLAAIFLSDVLFDLFNIAPGFYGSAQAINYALLALVTGIGFFMKKINVVNVAFFSIISCLVFFLFSNTAYFLLSNPAFGTYPQTFDGYIQSLIAGLPFLRASLISTGCFGVVFFGVYALSERYILVKEVA
ncbi:MAG: DUF6580 family putative transport protein, partial [Ferruginibacter sp.]